MEGGHCFFDGSGGVEAMDLVEVDVGGVEAAEGGRDGGEDGLTGEPCVQEEISRRTQGEGEKREGVVTVVVDVVFAFGDVGGERGAPDLRRFTHGSEAFS